MDNYLKNIITKLDYKEFTYLLKLLDSKNQRIKELEEEIKKLKGGSNNE